MEKHRVLVAEDDPFQRMSIVDILQMSNYDVTSVENGKQALEHLGIKFTNQGSTQLTTHSGEDSFSSSQGGKESFDLVLLDLLMPEMTGKEVLDVMMSDPVLSNIPVVVMSSRNDKSIISECLVTGARTFIVKPLRAQEVRGFETYIKEEMSTDGDQNMRNYKSIKNLGHGSAGSVDLVENLETGNQYALKTIALANMNQKEKESALSEIHFLKVLKGPTLIKSYQSYVEKDKIMIFMEYAEGGTLADKILEYKLAGEAFDTDTIINWISQVILGVMLMHSKNILHRDLKSQNLFLVSDGTIKIGDFGISKELPSIDSLAKTSCGTPYFMPPEVCKGEPYGEKIDIWAIGCILYELVFFKKPFESKTIYGVFEKIINTPLEHTYEECDENIRMLLMALLDKDPSRRPSIWELAKTDIIKYYINQFVNERGLHEEVATVFECDMNNDDPLSSTILSDSNTFDTGRLDIMAHFIRLDIPLEEIKNGWFSKIKNLGSGFDILNWMRDKVEADEDRALMLCQKMMDHGYIARIDEEQSFSPLNTVYYQFYEDRDNLAANMLRPYYGEPLNAIEVSLELVKNAEEVYREAIVETDTGHKIVAERALISQHYEHYICNVGKLSKVELKFYGSEEAYCFFLNVYQCMYIHCFLKYLKPHQDEMEQSGSLFSNLRSFMGNSDTKEMFYQIGDFQFTLDELKHGVIRGNRKKPGSILKTFNVNDMKAQFIDEEHYDRRAIFLCLDLPQVLEHIAWFDGVTSMDENYDPYLKEFLNSKVAFDPITKELTLPNIFETYYYDFGNSNEDIIKFIWNWFENTDYSCEQVLKLCKSDLKLNFYPMVEYNSF